MPTMTGAQGHGRHAERVRPQHLFMVPAVLRRTMVELERRTGIRRLHVHSEKSAAYMADGYARATGRPGVCMAQVIAHSTWPPACGTHISPTLRSSP